MFENIADFPGPMPLTDSEGAIDPALLDSAARTIEANIAVRPICKARLSRKRRAAALEERPLCPASRSEIHVPKLGRLSRAFQSAGVELVVRARRLPPDDQAAVLKTAWHAPDVLECVVGDPLDRDGMKAMFRAMRASVTMTNDVFAAKTGISPQNTVRILDWNGNIPGWNVMTRAAKAMGFSLALEIRPRRAVRAAEPARHPDLSRG